MILLDETSFFLPITFPIKDHPLFPFPYDFHGSHCIHFHFHTHANKNIGMNVLIILSFMKNCFVSNLVVLRRCCPHVAVHSCLAHRETVEVVEETCGWAPTVTSRWLWTTYSRRRCRLFPLRWWLARSKVDQEVLRTWRPMFPTETRSVYVWRSYEMTGRRSLNKISRRERKYTNISIRVKNVILCPYFQELFFPVSQKQHTLFLPISSPNCDRFSKSCHHKIQK